MSKGKRKRPKARKPMPKPSRPMTSRDRRRILERLFEAIRKAGLYD